MPTYLSIVVLKTDKIPKRRGQTYRHNDRQTEKTDITTDRETRQTNKADRQDRHIRQKDTDR